MRTLIRAGWVVGYEDPDHCLLRNGVVVYDGDRILHVGHDFAGDVDRVIDASRMLVSPGFINTHIHAGTNARSLLLLDATKTDYFGQNFLSYGAALRGVRRPARDAQVESKFGFWAALRGGATTVVDVGMSSPDVESIAAVVGELGIRAYLGISYRDASYVFDAAGRVNWDWHDGAGLRGLQAAKAFIRAHHGDHKDRVRGMLFPGQLDTTTTETLVATKLAAAELAVGIQLHAAMNLIEFHSVLRERQQTPLQYLAEIDFLGPEVILGHCVFHAGHSWAHYPYVDDLSLVAASGASIAHAPNKYAKMGLALESFERYVRRGINVTIGTDTFPQDMLSEMRLAGLITRLIDGSFRVGRPRDLFNAATLGGAKALGRNDLGRIAPGAKADLIVVDLAQVHYGAVRDPIRSLIECGTSSDVRTVIVDGETLVDEGRAVGFDEAALLREVQDSAESFWESVDGWRPKNQTVDEIAPMSYAIHDAPPT